jgi:hypothetical protein
MSIFHNTALIGASGRSGAPAGYSISRSLRFNSSDSAYLSRTPASAGNRKTWTWAGWVKRGKASTGTEWFYIFDSVTTNPSTGENYIRINGNHSGHTLEFKQDAFSGAGLVTSQVFRDHSAWFHLVAVCDTTSATSTDRMRLYINGERVTAFSSATYPTQNADGAINNTTNHSIGRTAQSGRHFDGYLADIHFIDGQALTPTSFGEFDATTGVWVPKAYTGSYGTNGFRLPFSDNSAATATTLGKDSAGSNNWTPNNLSVTAGAGNDSLVDVPTNGAQTDTGAGGEVRGNYCTLNPLESANTLSNGNLDVTSGSASWKISASTIYAQTGKWYCEFTLNAVQGYPQIGVYAAGSTFATSGLMGTSATGYAYNSFNGNKINNSSSTSYGNSWTTGDTIGIAYDLDNGALYFSKNGTWQNSGVPTSGASKTGAAFSLPAGIFYTVAISAFGSDAGSFNFGARAFSYTAPSGFKALNTANLPAPLVTKPSTVMDVKLYTGNGSTQTISGLGFSPDLLWFKSRSTGGAGYNNIVFDAVRGSSKSLATDLTNSEFTGTDLTSFNSDGFTLAAVNQWFGVNNNGTSFVAWAWDAGSSTVTNTQGSITSSVRANATAGFSVVSLNAATGTYGHGLGVAPQFIISRARNRTSGWLIYHSSATSVNQYLAFDTNSVQSAPNLWGSITSTTIGMNLGVGFLGGDTVISYCFAPVVGYSSFGSYTGNGSSDGPFVYTGFRPRWVMVKASTSVSFGSWRIYDSARGSYNVIQQELYANLSNSEDASNTIVDFLSNGFKLRSGAIDGYNGSGATIIYAAFAESPFNYSRAR